MKLPRVRPVTFNFDVCVKFPTCQCVSVSHNALQPVMEARPDRASYDLLAPAPDVCTVMHVVVCYLYAELN